MKRAAIAGGAMVVLLLLVALGVSFRAYETAALPAPEEEAAAAVEAPPPPPRAYQGFLYGRVTTEGGTVYEGRLRWGGGEEAFWSDFFNGEKSENAWAAHVPPDRLPREGHSIEVFGLKISERQRPVDLDRLFMTRFGELVRIEKVGFETIRVTLKSGTTVELDGLEAGDFDDGVRVWDEERGVVDLERREIRSIDFLPTRPFRDPPARLHGSLRAKGIAFTGFAQWNRDQSTGDDELEGRSVDGTVRLRFDALRAIARDEGGGALVTLADGREIALTGGRAVGPSHRGTSVDDPRFGRVLVSWDALERLDLSAAADSGPAYDAFEPGRPLAGRVTTRDGRSLAGRIVFDLDESETTDTLDAPRDGIDYSIPFGRVASIAVLGEDGSEASPVRVRLHDGAELDLEPAGDLGERNAGLLIFVAGGESPEYLLWSEVRQLDLDPPPTTAPPPGPS